MSPDPLTATKVHLDRQDGDLLPLVVEKRRLVSKRGNEERHPRCSQHQGVMRIFDPRQPGAPGRGVAGRHTPALVHAFGLTIRLRVIARRETHQWAKSFIESLPYPGGQLGQGHRGIGNGFRRPERGWCEDFARAHTGQAAMNALVSRTIDGHQKHCRRRCRVWFRPG